MTSQETRFRVRYAETDQMGVVYYANYLIWMEIGRTEFCRALGLQYREMEEQDNILLAVVDAHCRYVSPAKYDDEVAVITTILKAHRRMIVFGYEIRTVSGRALATGETTHIYLGRDLKPVRLPEKYYRFFGIPRTDAWSKIA
jgi:acyl-CoA thioester hydrolase